MPYRGLLEGGRSTTRGLGLILATLAAVGIDAVAKGACLGDLDGSGSVDGTDLGAMLAAWNSTDPSADLNRDGRVDGADIGLLFASWGDCPCPPDSSLTPLHDVETLREPDVVEMTDTALVTRFADRARDRHAREGQFSRYDHWLPFYWEQRVAEIEIEDRVARGGAEIVFRFMTHDALDPAEFRTFYCSGYAGYCNNLSDYENQGVLLVEIRPSVEWPGEIEYHYESVVSRNVPGNRPLEIGDRMEVELSQFLLDPRNGRENYYGTAFLYIVGEGIVPWYAKEIEEGISNSLDSYPLPEHAWLGGTTTLPYQYSNEPEDRFKQMAGNLAIASGHRFTQGRRLHHTDFVTGEHSEPGNPIFEDQIGKAGPKFLNTSCVGCHVNNGRSLPPSVGGTFLQSVIRVASDVDGNPHPILGDTIQSYPVVSGEEIMRVEGEEYFQMSGIQTEPCGDVGGGLNIGFVDDGDWMAYYDRALDVTTSGPYTFEFRVASAGGGGSIELSTFRPKTPLALGTIAVPDTGGWQTWQTRELEIFLEAGTYRFRLDAPTGGWNLNWFAVRGPADPASAGDGFAVLDGWEIVDGTYGDGTPYELRRPIVSFSGRTPEHHAVRNAMPLVGIGLLEAIDEQTILDLADPCDDDGDGISGRAHFVPDPIDPSVMRLGRFTSKANRSSVREQIARALNRDMGVATAMFPVLDEESNPRSPEIDEEELDRLTRYVALLGVGARRDLQDPLALQGEALFTAAKCSSCHVAELSTGMLHPHGELRGQTIRPFTDLLLHDLGPGLAETIKEGDAEGSEWRTAPLWNIGLTEGVAGGKAYLHDGRARTLEEAILWHGGEAEASRETFRNMSTTERAAIVAFLESL